jgi:hypothetical protein
MHLYTHFAGTFKDKEVVLLVALCISEIMRISTPDVITRTPSHSAKWYLAGLVAQTQS